MSERIMTDPLHITCPLTHYQRKQLRLCLHFLGDTCETDFKDYLSQIMNYDDQKSIIENFEQIGSGGFNFVVSKMEHTPYYENLKHEWIEQYAFAFIDKNETVLSISEEWQSSYEQAFADGILHSVLHDMESKDATMLIVSDCECRTSPPYFTRDTLVDCYLWHDTLPVAEGEKSIHEMIMNWILFDKLPSDEEEFF